MIKSRLRLVVALLSIVIVLDQITKVLARDFFKSSPPVHYLGEILTFLHSENTGAFLSLGAGLHEGVRFWIFTVAVALFLIGALYYVLRTPGLDTGSQVALTLMVGGGIGNLIDRIDHGSVTDFIHLALGPVQTGVFNVADMAISGGTLYLLYTSYRDRNATSQKTGSPSK
jgi:signal peptidase II